MPTVPDRPQPTDDPAARALADWIRTADVAEFNTIGLRRITAIWMAAWEAAMRERAERAAEPNDGR